MNATSLFDASELTAFADKLLAKGVARRAAITMAVKKGAQNVKNDLREDLSSSGNKAFRRIPITYTVKEAPGRISAEIGPTKGGAGSLANIAFFGTAKGGGTHRFYEHGEEELPKLAEYVARAAVEGFDNDLVEHDSRPCAKTCGWVEGLQADHAKTDGEATVGD